MSGSGGLGQSQGGSQCLPPNMSAPNQRKGTFTDDLHKLVDNWARDAMNLSQVYCRFMIYVTAAEDDSPVPVFSLPDKNTDRGKRLNSKGQFVERQDKSQPKPTVF